MTLYETSQVIENACKEANSRLRRSLYDSTIYKNKAMPIIKEICTKYKLDENFIYKVLEIKEA
jgi:Mor family transcriptional regulator